MEAVPMDSGSCLDVVVDECRAISLLHIPRLLLQFKFHKWRVLSFLDNLPQTTVLADFTSSVGIAHNKLLAKVGSARNKPDQQTIVTSR